MSESATLRSPWNASTVSSELDGVKTARGDNTLAQVINYTINTGCKNYCPYDNLTATQAVTILNDQPINLPSGTYILTFKYTATTGSSSFRFLNNGTSILNFTVNNTSSGTASREFTLNTDANQLRLYTSVANTYTNVMIRSSVVSDATFQPYAPTSRELYEMILAIQSQLGMRSVQSMSRSLDSNEEIEQENEEELNNEDIENSNISETDPVETDQEEQR